MFYHLIYPLYALNDYTGFLNIFRYITFRSALAVVLSLIVFIIWGKPFIQFMQKKTDRVLRKLTPDRHKKKSGTPSMGGILITSAVIFSIGLMGNFTNANIVLCLIAFAGFSIIGFVDDYIKEAKKDGKGIASRFKFTAQVLLSSGIVLYIYFYQPNIYLLDRAMSVTELTIPFFSNVTVDLGVYYIPFAVLVIVGSSNGVNMTDGLDGLAAGLTTIIIIALTGFAYLAGHSELAEYLKIPYIPQVGEISVFTAAVAGACLGFLWYNCHPAQVFMGDTGSLSLGGLIGVMAVLLKIELLLPILGGVFVLETMSVILQVMSYKFRNKRIFRMAPIHHHFELMGWHENKIIMRFWILGALLALLALASLKIR